MGRYIAQNNYNHDDNTTGGAEGSERDMLPEFVCYALAHFLFRWLRLSSVTTRTEAGELRNVISCMKTQIPGKLVLSLT